MITRSQNFNGCGNKIFLDCESDAYQSVKRQNDYRITKLDYNEATGILSISQNPDVTKFTNIGDNSVTSNTFRSHLDAIEYILDYNKFKKSGTSKFDKCSNYLVYNQYADADKKYIYFTYSENANRWYEISLNEGDEFYDKLKNVKYRYHNGRLVNIVDVKLTKSQDRVGDRGTNITLNVEPSTSKGVVIPVVDEYNAGLMHPNDYRRFKDIDSELFGSFNIVDVNKNHWKLELVNKNGEVIASILIDKDNDNYLHDVEATITNGRRTLNFQMYDKTGPTTIYNVDLEDWFDYTGLETSSIKVEVNDSDEISANLKISSDKDNTLSLDNEGLVSILKWLDGDRINFKLGTEVDYDSKVFENVIYFATDTKNIIINGNKYGIDFNDNDIDLVSKIEFTDTIGEFKITNTNGEIYTLSLPLATEEYNGLMSAADKKKLNTLANTSISQISKVFRDGQQGLEIVFSDIAANQTRIIFIPFSEVDRENNGLMSIADKIKLDNVDIIVNKINPFELEDEQFGTRLVYTVRDYRDPSNPVDITKYQELPLVQDTSSGLMPKEYKIKSDRILMYLQSVNTELTKTADTNTITFIEYNPNNNQSREVLVTFDEVTETEAGLLGAIDKVKLNRIVDYLISIEPETTKTSNTQVININRYNPNTNETVIDNVTITEATNEHAGLLTSIEHGKLEGIVDYVNDLVDTSNTEGGRDINYTKYDSELHKVTEHSILIPNATQTENGLQSSSDKIKEDNITTYPREFQDAVSDDQGVNIAYNEYQPSDASNVSSKINIKLATQTENGVMSSTDKIRLDNAPQDAYTNISLDVTEDNYTIVTEQKDRDSGELTTTRLDLPIANDDNRGIISKETNKGLNHNYIELLSQNVNSDSINILSKNTNPLTNVTTENVPNITLQSATRDTAGIITSTDYQRFDNIPQTIEYNTSADFSEDKYQVSIKVKDIDNNTESINTIDFPLVSKTNRGLQSKEDKIKSDNIIDYVDEVSNFVTSDEGVVSTITHYNPSNGDTRESTISINNATSTENGSMSAADKVKLDNLDTTIGDGLEEAKQYTDSKVGDLNFSSSNYVQDTTNVTEAITGLDTQIKTNADDITNLQNDLNTLDSEAVKGIKVGNNSNTEAFTDGIVTIRNAGSSNDGTLSKEIYKNLDEIPYAYGIDLGDNNGSMQVINLRRKDLLTGVNDYTTVTLYGASDSQAGLLIAADKTKLDNLSSSLETSIEDAVNQAKEYADATFLPLSGGTMTGPISIPYNGIQTSSGNRLIFYNDSELWFGHKNYRGVWETSNTDLLHRKNDTNYTILDTSNFIAGTDYLAPGGVTIADISDLGSTWDSYLKAGVYNRNITVNGTSYPVMTNVSGATAINIYAPKTAGTAGQFLKSTGGTPSWNSITVADISNLNSTWDTFMTGSNLATRNILINGSAWTVYSSVGTDTTRIYAPTTMSTNSNQVLTGSSDSIPKWGYPNLVSVHDVRSLDNQNPTPDDVTGGIARFYFTNRSLPSATGMGQWVSKLTVAGWNAGYNVWELAGGSTNTLCENLAFRAGINDTWGDWHTIAFQDWTNTQLAKYLPLSGGTLTGALHFSGAALPRATTTDFFLCINAFDAGGQVKYIDASDVLAAIGGASSSSLNNYLPLTGGTLTGALHITSGGLNVTSGRIRGVEARGMYINGKTLTNALLSASFAQVSNSYSPYFAAQMLNGDVVNIGGIGNRFGIYGYDAARTANGQDWLFEFNSDDGSLNNSICLGSESNTAYLRYRIRRSGVTTEFSNSGTTLNLSITNGSASSSINMTPAGGLTFNSNNIYHAGNLGTITFTGAVSATYNGQSNITVNIPTAGGGVADSIDWSNVINKPTFATVATSGSYNDLSDKPSIPSAYTLPIASSNTLGGIKVGAGLSISSAGVLSATGGGVADSVDWDNITSKPSWVDSTSKPTYTWSEISGKPSSFTPASHTHSASDITSGTLAIARIPTGTTSSTVALGNHGHHFDDITFNNTGTNRQYLAGNGNFYTIAYSELSGTPDLSDYASSSHTHGTDDIVYLTGYTEGTSTTTLNANMTLNLALASLQNQIQTKQAAGNYATESYVDDAVANVNIDTSGFVTLTGTQTISGAKTFTNSNGVRSSYGFYDTSDIRLKSNIKDIELKDKINLYEFDKQGKHSYGVIAQEVEQLYPSVVNTDENGYKTVNYNEVLSIKCAELEAENKELKARLDKLEALVNSLL